MQMAAEAPLVLKTMCGRDILCKKSARRRRMVD